MDLSEMPIDVNGLLATSVVDCEPARATTPEDERRARINAVGFDYHTREFTRHPKCNLCGGESLKTFEQPDRYGFGVVLTCCRDCGLVCLNPHMTAEGYADFYDSGTYRKLVAAHNGGSQPVELLLAQQASYAGAIMQTVAQYLAVRAGHEYLDIGGSTGVIAGALKGAFALGKTLVLDPCEMELARVKAHGCVPLHGTAEGLDTQRGAGSFGVITLLQTIDHLLDPAKVLQAVRTLLHPEGVFICDIVNFQTLLSRYGLSQAVKIDHPYCFTPETIEAYLLRAGFEIAESFASDDERHVFYVCGKGEPQDVLPDEGYPAAMLQQLQGA